MLPNIGVYQNLCLGTPYLEAGGKLMTSNHPQYYYSNQRFTTKAESLKLNLFLNPYMTDLAHVSKNRQHEKKSWLLAAL